MQKRVTIWPVGTSMRLRTIKDEGTIFRSVPPDSLQALALVNAAIDKLGTANGKLVSVCYRNEPYGEGLAMVFSNAWATIASVCLEHDVFDSIQDAFYTEARQSESNTSAAILLA